MIYHKWLVIIRNTAPLSFVLGPLLAPRIFLRILQFSYLHENEHLKVALRLAWKPTKNGVFYFQIF